MITQIITEENDHFEWRIGEDGEPYKHILSDNKLVKQVKVTYDQEGNEISREAYSEPAIVDIPSLLSNQTPEQLATLAKQLKQLLNL